MVLYNHTLLTELFTKFKGETAFRIYFVRGEEYRPNQFCDSSTAFPVHSCVQTMWYNHED
jgi:hypothetical protein